MQNQDQEHQVYIRNGDVHANARRHSRTFLEPNINPHHKRRGAQIASKSETLHSYRYFLILKIYMLVNRCLENVLF